MTSVSSIINSPFVGKDGKLTREGYYFLLGLNNATGGTSPTPVNSSVADVQLLEEINDALEDVGFASAQDLNSTTIQAFFQDDQTPQRTAAVGNSDSVLTWMID